MWHNKLWERFNLLKDGKSNKPKIGGTIRTDGWSGYSELSSLGYIHTLMSNPDVKNNDVVEKAHLVASLLKRWLIGTLHGGVGQKHLPYYLDELTFRFNRRTSRSRGKLFYRLIQQALEINPVTAKSLSTTYCGLWSQLHTQETLYLIYTTKGNEYCA